VGIFNLKQIFMNIKKTAVYFFAAVAGVILLAFTAQAATPVTLTLNNTAGDAMQVSVKGEPSANIQLSFLPPGASMVTSIGFGATDSNGNFSTSISSGGYGIPSGSPAYVTINGMQSPTALWPSYTSSLSLSQASVQVGVGQAITVNAASALILISNSNNVSFSAAVSGSQITVTGITAGSGTLNLCGANAGCASLAVVVGGQGQTQVALSQNVVVLKVQQTQEVYVFGGPSGGGYVVSANSNPAAVTASISGMSSTLILYGNTTPGAAIISICSRAADTNCASLNVTTLNNYSTVLSFNPNNLSLVPSQLQTVTVSGGPDNSYYISSNNNTGVAGVTISGATVSVVGGSNSGSAVISICSTSVNGACGNLYVTTNATAPVASATALAFSQNVVSIVVGQVSNVTVNGGAGTGYSITANSNPSAVTASINGNSNIIALHGGDVTGSAIITVCSASAGNTCASLYVTVKPATLPFSFSQNNISLASGQVVSVAIVGGSDASYVVSGSSGTSTVAASLMSNGKVIALTGGTVPGTATITVCSAADASNCSTLSATLTASAAASAPFSFSQNNISLISGQTITITINGSADASYLVSANSSSRTVAASTVSDGKAIALTGGTTPGTTIITVCSAANANNCSTLYATLNASTAASTSAPAPAATTPAAAVLGATTSRFTSLLTLGSSGQEVCALQQLLKNLGYYAYSSITGYFGPATKKAVIAYQKANNLKPYPGWVGPSTRDKLNSIKK